VAVSCIGQVQAEPGLRLALPGGQVEPLAARGFDHFAAAP
jgi:thiamine monophosphate kinase